MSIISYPAALSYSRFSILKAITKCYKTMEDIILESHLPHISPPTKQLECHLRAVTSTHLENRPLISHKQPQAITARTRALTADFNASWGRSGSGISLLTTTSCAGILTLCPLLVFVLWSALEDFDGSLLASLSAFWSEGPVLFAAQLGPAFSLQACVGYVVWLSFQATLYTFLPCKTSTGQLTPAGNLLKYKTNGLSAWFVTHCLVFAAAMVGVLDLAIIAKHWGGILIAANIYGFFISTFSYMKAQVAPTHPEDRKFSGQKLLSDLELPH